MKQLSLFDDTAPREERAPDVPVPEPGVQLDLFADRTLLLLRARDHLAHLETDAARRSLREGLARYPGDTRLADEAAVLDELSFRVDKALRAPASERAAALVAVADRIEPLRPGGVRCALGATFPHQALWTTLLRRAAEHAIEKTGDASLVGGVHEPGWLLLLAGDTESARESLTRAHASTGRASFLALLGEHALCTGDRVLARQLYFSALRDNPYDVDLASAGDSDVQELPSIVRDRFEIDEEPLAWCAATGVVIGLFHLPMVEEDTAAAEPQQTSTHPPERAAALRSSEDFLAALAASRRHKNAADLLAARRTMKRLQPSLFHAVMGRPPEG